MAEVKVLYDHEGKTLTVWFTDACEENVCEETGEEVILIKYASGRVIGFEKLNFPWLIRRCCGWPLRRRPPERCLTRRCSRPLRVAGQPSYADREGPYAGQHKQKLGSLLEAYWWTMNPLLPQLKTGTIGELLVQLRLLQYDVQAVSPHKDTGNDLLAVRGETFRAVQVKTCATGGVFKFDRQELMTRAFHILALVQLKRENRRVLLDTSSIFLLRREEVTKGRFTADELQAYKLDDRVAELFP